MRWSMVFMSGSFFSGLRRSWHCRATRRIRHWSPYREVFPLFDDRLESSVVADRIPDRIESQCAGAQPARPRDNVGEQSQRLVVSAGENVGTGQRPHGVITVHRVDIEVVQVGSPSRGKARSAICRTPKAATPYTAMTRKTFRRLSSAKNLWWRDVSDGIRPRSYATAR